MANLTIVVDDHVLQRARIRALQHGTSVNALLRDYLASFAGDEDASAALAEFHDLAAHIHVKSTERWTREELYDRAVMRNG
jgi:plasmid stability protein